MVLKQFIDHDSSWHAHWPLLSFGMALPTGPRFHSTAACVAVCVHIAIQKILPLSNKRICAGIRVSISSGSAVPCLLNLSTLGLVPCVLAKGSMVGLRRKALHSATAALSGFAQLLLWGALKRRTNWVFSLWDRLYVVQTGFKLMILLLQPSGCCNYCHAPPYLTLLCSVCVCVPICTGGCTCVTRPEVNIKCPSQSLSTLCFATVLWGNGNWVIWLIRKPQGSAGFSPQYWGNSAHHRTQDLPQCLGQIWFLHLF